MNTLRIRPRLPLHTTFTRRQPPTQPLRPFQQAPIQRQQQQQQQHPYSTDSLPTIAQPSFWKSLVPKFLRNRDGRRTAQARKSKEWNPASFFIIIFILIGSQAIRMITLKKDYATYSRTTNAKIELLREVIEKIKNGEEVDVEKLLGTGDEAKEREWEEVLREIEAEDSLWHRKHKESESNREAHNKENQNQQIAATTASTASTASTTPVTNIPSEKATETAETQQLPRTPRFF